MDFRDSDIHTLIYNNHLFSPNEPFCYNCFKYSANLKTRVGDHFDVF